MLTFILFPVAQISINLIRLAASYIYINVFMSFLVAAQSQGPLGPYRSWKQGRAMLRSPFPDNILI